MCIFQDRSFSLKKVNLYQNPSNTDEENFDIDQDIANIRIYN